jgi:AraC-like DNA-binding protein
VFLHGTAEQYQRHTERMLELEQEYLRRHPKRTWQGAGASPQTMDEATRLRLALRSLQRQIDAIVSEGVDEAASEDVEPAKVAMLVQRIAASGGRMHKLELHQLARELGISPAGLARLYRGEAAVLRTERDQRVLISPQHQ